MENHNLIFTLGHPIHFAIDRTKREREWGGWKKWIDRGVEESYMLGEGYRDPF